jgi:hypothetical protein
MQERSEQSGRFIFLKSEMEEECCHANMRNGRAE